MKLYAVTTLITTIIGADIHGPHEIAIFKDRHVPAVFSSRKKADKLAKEMNDEFPGATYNVLEFNS